MKSRRLLLIIIILFFTATSAAALDFGSNITMYDGRGTGTGWHGAQEDQEVEPGDVPGQNWDLEGFFLNGSKLTMVGGFDFIGGVDTRIGTIVSGDIFIDINGDAQYGTALNGSGGGYATVDKTYGYDYVLDLDFDDDTGYSYDVYELTDASTVTVYYSQNEESNPWRYAGGGTKLIENAAISYYTGLSDSEAADLEGGSHNALTVDIGFLGGIIPGDEFIAHFTIGCGNDNLMGKGTAPVPEPTTILLSGLGLLGMGFFLRRRVVKSAADFLKKQ